MSFILEVSLYLGCKINCSYCPQNILYKNTEKKYLNFSEYKQLINTVPPDVEIAFCGMSEPLLHTEFEPIARYTLNKGHKISCFTTLPSTFTQNVNFFLKNNIWNRRCVHIIDEFMSSKIDELYLKNIENYFSVIDKNDRQVNTISILTKNVDSRINDLLEKYGIKHLPYYEIPYMRIKAPIPRFTNPIISQRLKGAIYCSQGHDKIQHLLPNGDVVLCCMDIEKKHLLGNLYINTYNSIFNSVQYNFVKEGFNKDLNTICRTCIMAKNNTSNSTTISK